MLHRQKERVHINRGSKKASGMLKILSIQDGDSIVCIIPSLQLTSYGEDLKDALEMMHIVIDDYFNHLLKRSDKDITKELAVLGYNKIEQMNKSYERPYIDIDGVLQKFDIDKSTIISEQMLELTE